VRIRTTGDFIFNIDIFLDADYERKLLDDEVGRGQMGTRFKTQKFAGPRVRARERTGRERDS